MVTTSELSTLISDTTNPIETLFAVNAVVNGLLFATFIVVLVIIVFLSARGFGNTMAKSFLSATWTGALLSILLFIPVYNGIHGVPLPFVGILILFAAASIAVVKFETNGQ